MSVAGHRLLADGAAVISAAVAAELVERGLARARYPGIMESKPRVHQLNLSTFDGKLLDGLEFCRSVYEFFDQVRNGPSGIERIRLRKTTSDKRLMEELIPLAHYIQARYREGRRIKVRWFSGSQRLDALLWSSGVLVQQGYAPRRTVVEITTSVHKNEHLTRQLINQQGASFGPKSTFRDKKTGKIVSQARAYDGYETLQDLASQIIDRIHAKANKGYSSTAVLIINCVANSLTLENEWNAVIGLVKTKGGDFPFREVFLHEAILCHSATLYGRPRSDRAEIARRPG